MKTKIVLLRTVHAGEYYLEKGTTAEVPAELAQRLIAEKSAQLAEPTGDAQ